MTFNALSGHFTLNFHYYELTFRVLLAGFESIIITIIYLFHVESVYIRVSSGDVGSGVAHRYPQNIWNPRKNCGCFRCYIVGILTHKAYVSISSLIAFPLSPKHVTLNDLEWPFCVKFCFAPVRWELKPGFRSLATLKLLAKVGEL